MTDISSVTGGFKEPDDAQSLVRFLLYANEFDIEYTNHWKDRKPAYIREILEPYGQVHGNLSLHDPAFPGKEGLLRVVKAGNPNDGPAFVGEEPMTGSRL
ncbi:nucleoside hydrolase-like domain-containing protein [Cohnella sp. GCM10012308]|uniref:nucleoside hydrolase-like domain-containing protein n=1 Tax=Cohnella sp. GCM10012308 TaxID=3317329 RepID=UPI00361CAB36